MLKDDIELDQIIASSSIEIVIAAIVTPPDVITQIILFVVVYGLYEVSIFLVARTEKQMNEQFADDDYSQDADNDFDDPLIKDFDEKK